MNIAIIPARGGSVGIKDKNIVDFCGRPLLAWSILQASECSEIERVYVTSDSDAILRVAEEAGAVPIRRPDEMATATAPSEQALLHAVDIVERDGGRVEAVVFLQATSPLRTAADIGGALQVFRSEGADSLFSCARMEDICLWHRGCAGLKSVTYDYLRRGRRQDREPYLLENGSIYIFKPSVLRATGNRLGGRITISEMDAWKSFEIDSPEDLVVCEYFMRNRILGQLRRLTRADIDLIVCDFDGVLTDNRALVSENGLESVLVNRSDGWAFRRLREMGFRTIILSTEENQVVAQRGRKLQTQVVHGVADKAAALDEYCGREGIDKRRVLYLGNDVNDLQAMRRTGYSAAPSDAHERVLEVARIKLKARGGAGVVAELVEGYLGS